MIQVYQASTTSSEKIGFDRKNRRLIFTYITLLSKNSKRHIWVQDRSKNKREISQDFYYHLTCSIIIQTSNFIIQTIKQ